MSDAPAPGGLPAVARREAAADLIPRFDGATLQFTSRRALEAPGRVGLVLGPLLLDVADDGRLEGATLLEERRFWERAAIGWALPARATPHRLNLIGNGKGAPPAISVRWDAERSLCAIVLAEAEVPEVVALGPRAFAAIADGRLAGLLADLRGFGRAAR